MARPRTGVRVPRSRVWLTAALATLLLVACGGSPASGTGSDRALAPVSVAMISHGLPSDPFWATLRQGAEQAAKDFDVHLTYATSGAAGSASEATLIQQAAARHPQAMAVTIPDAQEESGAIEQVTRSGTPVVVFNDGVNDWQSVGALDYIGQNDAIAGQEAGQQLAAFGLRHVLCVIDEQDNAALQTRCQAIAQVLEPLGGTEVPITVPGGNLTASAADIEQALAQNPTIDGLMAVGPPAFDAIEKALGGRGLATTKLPHPVATFDATSEILSAVDRGKALFAINQQPYLQGYLSVQVLAQQVRQGLHPYQQITTGPLPVTTNNAANLAVFAQRQAKPVDYQKPVYISLVSHGPAGDPFWDEVEAGAEQAARDFGVDLHYWSPDAAGTPSQTTLMHRALATNPDAIAVTLPNQSAVNVIEYAVASYRPLLVFNAGEKSWQKLGAPENGGALDFIGQDDEEAGTLAGQQLLQDGAHHVLCVIHDASEASLRARCQAIAAVLEPAGGSVTDITVNELSLPQMRTSIEQALQNDPSIDTVMALGDPGFKGAVAALQATHRLGAIKLASFDTSSDILKAVASGQALFTIDQQPYLQGFLAVEILSQQIRLGLHPVGELHTGPSLVTRADADRILAQQNGTAR